LYVPFFLQKDPVFQKIHSEAGIASSPTCCRLEKIFTEKDEQNLRKTQKELRGKTYLLEKPKEVILDIDTTFDTASSKLEGAEYNTHYGMTCFSPLLCFDGISGDMIAGKLRKGSDYCSKDTEKFLDPIFSEYQEKNISMSLRGDSGFASPQIYEKCEEYKARYFIKLKSNSVLKGIFEEFEDKINQLEKSGELKNLRETEGEFFFETTYKAGSWNKERRILCRIQWLGEHLESSWK